MDKITELKARAYDMINESGRLQQQLNAKQQAITEIAQQIAEMEKHERDTAETSQVKEPSRTE